MEWEQIISLLKHDVWKQRMILSEYEVNHYIVNQNHASLQNLLHSPSIDTPDECLNFVGNEMVDEALCKDKRTLALWSLKEVEFLWYEDQNQLLQNVCI